jgi:diguanylate cyclase (GGDEF)-like protein/PAS domain S-box-containing protein
MNWQAGLPNIIAAIAYGCAAAALFNLFSSGRTKTLGPARWFVAGSLGLAGLLQLGYVAADSRGMGNVAVAMNLLSALCLLAIAGGLWPFLSHMNGRLADSIGRKVQRKVQDSEAGWSETQRWLLLSEEIAHVGHWHYDIASRKMTWSDEIYRIHGLVKGKYTPDVDSGIKCFHPDDRSVLATAFQTLLQTKQGYELALRLLRPNGEIRHVVTRAAAQLRADGSIMSVFGVFLDVTDQKHTEEKLLAANLRTQQTNKVLQELALVDSLTGLPNRKHFDATLDSEFRRAVRDGAALALIMIDLDRFKNFNEVYGRQSGDEAFRKVATAIASIPQRPGDLVARCGSGKIAVLLPGATKEGAEALARRFNAEIQEMGIAHKTSPEAVVTISCGVAVFHHAADALLPMNLIQHAEQALYEAKLCGRNRVSSYAERSLMPH